MDPAPDQPSVEPGPRRDRWHELRRRAPNLLLLVAIVAVILYTLHHRAISLEVVYELGSARRGLLGARMVYFAADGDEVRRVAFDYRRSPSGTAQVHPIQLLPGDYRVAIELEYRTGEVPSSLTRAKRERAATAGLEVIRLTRPLLVRGKGSYTIWVVGD